MLSGTMNAVFSTGPCPALGLFLALNQFPLPSRPPPSALTFHGAVVEVCAAGLAGPQDELPPRALLGASCVIWMLASCLGGRRRRCPSARMRAYGSGSEKFPFFGFWGRGWGGLLSPPHLHPFLANVLQLRLYLFPSLSESLVSMVVHRGGDGCRMLL